MDVSATINISGGARLFLIDNFFESQMVEDLGKIFSNVDGLWKETFEFSHNGNRLVYLGSNDIIDACSDYCSQSAKWVGQVLGYPVNYKYLSLWLDRDGYNLSPHYDLGDVDFGLQIYLCGPNFDPNLGLGIYKNAEQSAPGQLILTDEHKAPLFQLGYRNNCGYLADTSYTVLHGLPKPITGTAERWSVYVRYFKV